MALLAQRRIPVQDGPPLSMQIRAAALTRAEEQAIQFPAMLFVSAFALEEITLSVQRGYVDPGALAP
jgi:hypothetical protein